MLNNPGDNAVRFINQLILSGGVGSFNLRRGRK